jgi:hypothetical protein
MSFNDNRKMKVKLISEKDNKVYKAKGNGCRIVRKTAKTRLGQEFDETISCKKVSIKKVK